jgi:hypothetical protein
LDFVLGQLSYLYLEEAFIDIDIVGSGVLTVFNPLVALAIYMFVKSNEDEIGEWFF